jgi:DNA relaxase NicK
VLAIDGKMNRVDIALDDFDQTIRLAEVDECRRGGLVVSRFRNAKLLDDCHLTDGKVTGTAIYFGGPQSDSQVVFYDKAAQMRVQGPWVRVELRVHRKRAELLAHEVAARGPGVAAEVLQALLDFKHQGKSAQKDRWPSREWWSLFLGTCQRLPLSHGRRVSDLERKRRWLMEQVSPTVAELVETEGHLFLNELLEEGQSRLIRRRGPKI